MARAKLELRSFELTLYREISSEYSLGVVEIPRDFRRRGFTLCIESDKNELAMRAKQPFTRKQVTTISANLGCTVGSASITVNALGGRAHVGFDNRDS
jgi:hypothetical protein